MENKRAVFLGALRQLGTDATQPSQSLEPLRRSSTRLLDAAAAAAKMSPAAQAKRYVSLMCLLKHKNKVCLFFQAQERKVHFPSTWGGKQRTVEVLRSCLAASGASTRCGAQQEGCQFNPRPGNLSAWSLHLLRVSAQVLWLPPAVQSKASGPLENCELSTGVKAGQRWAQADPQAWTKGHAGVCNSWVAVCWGFLHIFYNNRKSTKLCL